jgi:putative transposase
MIVAMRTRKQAAKVAELTCGAQLAGRPKPDGTPTLSRYVDVGVEFEAHRAAVESVSVLFELYDGDADGYTAMGCLGEKLPTGWTVTAASSRSTGPATRIGRRRCGRISARAGSRSTGVWPR